MARAGRIARRSFLVGSVAIAGGAAFGVYSVHRTHKNPLLSGLDTGEAAFNPFVKVTSDKIVLIAPHADLGQGAQSMQANLILEELDADPDQVEVVLGTPSPAYYNTAVGADLVPFAAFDDSLVARSARSAFGAAVKVAGGMATGGSTSVPDSYDKLRYAGAVARETLKKAAAELSGFSVSDLKTARGAVILPDESLLSYTQLAAEASGLAPVTDVQLRAPQAWRLVGKKTQRRDIPAKSTGTQNFGLDLAVEGMVYAAVRINPRQGGALLGFDASVAQSMRGVTRILPLEGPVQPISADGHVSTRRSHVGVAVLADNTWRAFRAVEEVVCDWGPAPYPAEMEEHWQQVADSFTDERLDRTWREDGDVTGATGTQVDAEYRAPYAAHAPLEPLNAIVRAHPDHAEVWASHQLPRFVQSKVAAVLGLDEPDKVIFHNLFAGGSFGHRLEFENITLCAEIARQLPGVPVKLTFSREEDFAHEYPRQIGMARMRGTVSAGQIESFDAQVATVSATASQAGRLGLPVVGPDAQIPAGLWNMPFAIPNFRVRAYKVPELAPTSSWRSVGASTAGFFGESFMDELCHAAGVDPLEERLRLVSNDVHRKVLEAIGEMADWGRDLGAGRGRGLAIVESFGVPAAEVVDVTVTDAGIRIDRVFVAADVGRVVDPVNFEAQMMGGVVWGLGHAMNCEVTYSDGMAEQNNYDSHAGMRLSQCPDIRVMGLENAQNIRGIGEPPVPPAAPALANAIFHATGQRLREMPFGKFMEFA